MPKTYKNRMRILAISYLFPNSIYPNSGIFVLNRLKAVSKYCDVKVINPIPWFPFNSLLKRYKNYHLIPEKEVIEGIEVFHPRFFSIPRYLKIVDSFTFFLALFLPALKIKKIFPYDLIDVHWTYPDLPSAYFLARFLRKKQLITLRGKEALYTDIQWLYKKIILPLINRSDIVISLSRQLMDLCIAGGISGNKFRIIRNGADTFLFHFLDRDMCRQRLNLLKNERIIISVGSLIHRKGFDRIIKVMPEILKKYSGVILYIIGTEGPEGNYKKELIQLVKKYSLDGKVRFTGGVKNHELVLWYNAADVFCLASRSEGSPNVLSEALCCGCPSVATDVGSVPEILGDDSMGAVIPDDDNALFSGLMTVLAKKYDRRAISISMKQYDWDWCARQVVQVYREILEGKP